MAGETHGILACVFLDLGAGYAEFEEAAGFSIGITGEEGEVVRHKSLWKERHRGVNDWSGSITAYHNQDAMVLATAAQSASAIPLLIYPSCTDVTTYYSGVAFFDFDHTSAVNAMQTQTASFRGTGAMLPVGFA